LRDQVAGEAGVVEVCHNLNDQWRVCFVWRDGGAEEVEIVDYH
jgi:plasmid maintenance system killer protein